MSKTTKEQLLRAAKVFGLGGDVLGSIDKRVGMHKVIFESEFNLAIITRFEHIHTHRAQGMYTLGESVIAVHNSSCTPREFLGWEKQLTLLHKKSDGSLECQTKMLRDAEYAKHYLLPEATFAATEINGIPERIFLFTKQERFHMESVIELLRVHRILHPLPHVKDLGFIYSYW